MNWPLLYLSDTFYLPPPFMYTFIERGDLGIHLLATIEA